MSGGGLVELVDRDEALQMDEELVRMACSQAAVRLALGEAFVALGSGWQELGFSSFEGYVRERCARSPRWGRDTRAVARRLASLPRMREALVSRRINWCMAELLARHATREDEEELLEATAGMKVRQVREVLRDRGREPDPEEYFGELELSLDFEEACALAATLPMAELVSGSKASGVALEALLGEGQDWLTIMAPHADPLPEDVMARQKAWRASIAEGARRIGAREARAEASLPPMPEVSVSPIDALPAGVVAIDPALAQARPRRGRASAEREPGGAAPEIDRVIFRELAPRLASSELRFGELLAKFLAVRGWRVLGFASETQYARERLGMSKSGVHARIALFRRTRHLEQLGDALHDEGVGFEVARLIARVATPDTEAAWIARAKRRTYKHLAEEVHAVEMIAQMMRLEDVPGPPDEAEVAIAQTIERDFVSGAYARRAFAIDREDDAAPAIDPASSSPFAEMGRAVRTVQEQLRTVITAARERAGTLSDADALAACTGCVEPAGPLPMRDLEDDLVWSAGAAVQTSAAPTASASDDAAVQTSAAGTSRAAVQTSPAESSEVERALVQMSAGVTSALAAVQTSAAATSGGAVQTSAAESSEVERALVHASAGVTSGAAVQTSAAAMIAGAATPTSAGATSGAAAQTSAAATSGGAVQTSAASPIGGAVALVRRAECEPGDADKLEERIREGVRPPRMSVRLRIRASEETILHFRQLEVAYERSGMKGSFVQFLVLGFWAVWAPALGRANACEPTMRRDNYVCTCPVCGRPAGPGHHIRFRAHGGTDDEWNITSPCPWCHLDGVHGGRLRVTGEAPGELVWVIGRTPIMEVHGRERRLVA